MINKNEYSWLIYCVPQGTTFPIHEKKKKWGAHNEKNTKHEKMISKDT